MERGVTTDYSEYEELLMNILKALLWKSGNVKELDKFLGKYYLAKQKG